MAALSTNEIFLLNHKLFRINDVLFRDFLFILMLQTKRNIIRLNTSPPRFEKPRFVSLLCQMFFKNSKESTVRGINISVRLLHFFKTYKQKLSPINTIPRFEMYFKMSIKQ